MNELINLIPIDIQRFGGKCTLSHTYTQDIETNTSTFTLTATVTTDSSSYNSGGGAYVKGTYSGGASGSFEQQKFSIGKSKSVSKSWTRTVQHNPDGSISYISVSIPWHVTSSTKGTASGGFQLPAIPRYANITTFIVNRIDETSVSFTWAADVQCDYAWFSIDNGANWISLPNSNIISGLTPGTGYNFKLRVKRADSQLISESGTYYQTTYSYPTITSILDTNLLVGNEQKITVNNPLNRTYTFKVLDNLDNTELYSITDNSTNLTFTPDASIMQEKLISTNSESRDIKYQIEYAGVVSSAQINQYRTILVNLVNIDCGRASQVSEVVEINKISGNILLRNINDIDNSITIKYAYKEENQTDFSEYKTIVSNISSSNSNITLDKEKNTFELLKKIEIEGLDYRNDLELKIYVEDKYSSDEAIIKIIKGIPVWWWTKDYFASGKLLVTNPLLQSDNIEIVPESLLLTKKFDNGLVYKTKVEAGNIFIGYGNESSFTYQTQLGGEHLLFSGRRVPKATYNRMTGIDVAGASADNAYVEVTSDWGVYGINIWLSDKRLKRRIKDSNYKALDTINKIKHRQFIYRKDNKKMNIGYVADELQEIDENMIIEVGEQKIKQPNHTYLLPIISKGLQEEDTRITKLENKIDEQQKQIEELKNQVNKLLELVERKEV